jgi:hypothetical protein
MFDGTVMFERPALEDGGFGGAFGFGIIGFEREEKRMIGIAREGLDVFF